MAPHNPHKETSAKTKKPSRRNKHKQAEVVVEAEDNQQTVGSARNLWEAQVKVRNQERKAISSELRHIVEDLGEKIDTLAEKRRDRVRKLHQAEWDRLRSLIQQRREVELEILRSMNALESRSKRIVRDLKVIVVGREQDLNSLEIKMKRPQA
ncbi:hypothetical protein BP6252_05111 [Coleophoma cylindrospora]|uniref:Uncharacterized protein n=1 Tax=Coleophoma cylindrospora TaxID=1849047 RepID=A0A3D8RSW5_9HELO|nr:hypothetical protein BP6252_05111 [Coleophoma cylindrospora]